MKRFPLMTLILVTLNVLVYAAFEQGRHGTAVCYAYGLIPAHFEPSGLVTSLFLHDPSGEAHLAGNMVFLAVFGALVESALGGLPLLALYLFAGALGGLMHVVVEPFSARPLVGASGAIFGILAVASALCPRLLGFVLAFGGFEIWHAFAGGGGNVSFGCHLGGLVAGFLAAGLLRVIGHEVAA